ncbi:MAG TPA: hypothetical protein VLF43_03625, partial [Candidatus Saccharimonadales bacterium]|nr:hypothetical protein [Candidatus Saccharimonadales bacterium]
MNHLQTFITQVKSRLFLFLLLDNLLIFADWWVAEHVLHLSDAAIIASLMVCTILGLTILPWISARLVTQPIRLIWQAVLHIAPDAAN